MAWNDDECCPEVVCSEVACNDDEVWSVVACNVAEELSPSNGKRKETECLKSRLNCERSMI